MNIEECMLKRRSVRNFSSKDISDEDLMTLMHYAMSGPSACNRKPWMFYVVKTEEKVESLKKCTRYSNYNPKVIIVCFLDRKKAFRNDHIAFSISDIAAATENILLGATSLDLGSCWIGVYGEERFMNSIAKVLELEENLIPISMVYLGYKKEETIARDQFDINNVKFL